MTHQEIQANEIVEQYVRGKLTNAERRAFQEHFFECDECFQQVEVMASFVAGVREASRRPTARHSIGRYRGVTSGTQGGI